jgi:hypothetical protein
LVSVASVIESDQERHHRVEASDLSQRRDRAHRHPEVRQGAPAHNRPRDGEALMAKGKGGSSKGSTARSAKTGKFVTPGYAKAHPSTTVVSKNK